jgi:hypothetical protein
MNIKNATFNLINVLKNLGIKRILFVSLLVIAVLGVGGSYYFYNKYQETRANPNLEAKKETEALVASVGKLIELPKDEIPTVATILDKEKLKSQPFFKTGENGDKLLAYNVAMVAILYRPSTNKIINVAPITINQPQGMSAPAPLRIAYYNGAETIGLAVLAEKAVQEKYPNYQTSVLINASRKDYKGLLVIDLSGKHSKETSDLARLLNGKTGNLPQSEVAPDADILIISGK